MSLPSKVSLYEVGPRDGLQNEKSNVSTDQKIQLINLLGAAGLQQIEATSFVSPKWVPQMADHAEVMQALNLDNKIHYPVLIPNRQGMEKALECGAKDIAVFTAASETFSKKNTNSTIEESFAHIKEVINLTKDNDINVRGYVSCALGCPFEGPIDSEKVSVVAERLYSLGCYQISLGDTIGVGTPNTAQELIIETSKAIPLENIAVHFHDTYGQALANIYSCLELGIQTIDSSIAGLGGCPYAPGASGNVATEDVLYLLNGLGIETNVDIKKLLEATQFVHNVLSLPIRSKTAKALLAKS